MLTKDGEVFVNRVLEIDVLTSRKDHQVQMRALKERTSDPSEGPPEFHYSPVEDIMALQHALMALVFECERDGLGKKGEIFKIMIDTFQEMYINVELHDSVEVHDVTEEHAEDNED
jgi:hypothetical protein